MILKSYRILIANNIANGDVDQAHRVLNSLDHLERVDRILYKIMMDHAKSCSNVHYDRFASARASLNQETERRVATNFDSLINSNYNPLIWPTLAYRDTIMDNFLPATESQAKAAGNKDADFLFSLGEKTMVVHKDKYRQKIFSMLREFFFEPCEDYIRTMQP